MLRKAGLPAWRAAVNKLGYCLRDFPLHTLYAGLGCNKYGTFTEATSTSSRAS